MNIIIFRYYYIYKYYYIVARMNVQGFKIPENIVFRDWKVTFKI